MSVPNLPRTAEAFTSDFSAGELLLVSDGGWDPVELVCGDCSYGLGDQDTSWRYAKSLHRMSGGLNRGQTLALERMREQAAGVGGDGVVGVRLQRTEIELEGDPKGHPSQHFSAVGTAVRRRDGQTRVTGRPFTSHLSGHDTWALTVAGCIPLGLVFGFGVHHVRTTFQRPDRCVELPDLTSAVYAARGVAVDGMQRQALELRASGVVGVSIELSTSPGPTVTFIATGTAIRAPAGGPEGSAPQLVMDLNDAR